MNLIVALLEAVKKLLVSFVYSIKKKSRSINEGIFDNFDDSDIEGSDDDYDFEDDSEKSETKRIRVGSAFLTVEEELFVEGDSDEEDDQQWKFTEKRDIKWRKGFIEEKIFEYQPVHDDEGAEEYFSPLTYFMRYIPESLIDEMVTYTNTYAEQQQTKKWRRTDNLEMKQFIGLQIMMGNLKLPRIEMYYGDELQCKMFVDTIPLYRFYLLRTNWHLIDVTTISEDSTDKFVRVRPLMKLELPLEECLSVDEQMIPMRGRVTKGVKQYVAKKPKIKWGIKNLVLCGKSGLAYDFICYQGSTTEFDSKMLSTFGLGATMVLHLASRIDRRGHKLFFDNYFSSFPLFQILDQKKIYAAGTVRLDRFAKPPFSSDNEMKKKGRGSSEEVISEDGSVTCVKWFDNKCVSLASNYVGVGKVDTAHRYDKIAQKKINIDRPQIVRDYNINMGGVDLMNQMISYYRISIRSKKWTLRMITHFIDFSIVQSWIEYKMDCKKAGIPTKEVMDLLAFRMKLSKQLVYFQTAAKRSARITLDEVRSKHLHQEKSRERRTEEEVRYDEYRHYAKYSEKRLRCKLESCNQKSQVICSKCNVHLCLNKNNDCFYEYHVKSK